MPGPCHLFLLLLILALAACSGVKPPSAASPAASPAAAPAPPAAPAPTAPLPDQVAIRQTTVERLVFEVDPASSSGHIEATLDPYRLGPRSDACECPLGGTVEGELTTRPDGSRSLSFETVELATTSDGRFLYNWSPLIGTIRTVIPSGKLTISRNTFPGPVELDPHGQFERHGNKFTVGGIAEVVGRGLVLKKQVGMRETDLSIAQTPAIKLAGSLVRRDGLWILHVPAAVLRDRLEIDNEGSIMDLNFTANITAVARSLE